MHILENYTGLFYKLAQWCLLALAFLLPVWFLPTTVAPVEYNKVLMVSVLTFLAFIFYLAHAIKVGSVKIPYHRIFVLLAAMLFAWLVSALVANSGAALWGAGSETTSFFNVFTLFLMSLMIAMLFGEDRKLLGRFLIALSSGFLVMLLCVWLLNVFNLGRFLGGPFTQRFFNTIGSWNSVSFALGFFLVSIIPLLLAVSGNGSSAGRTLRLALYALFALSLLLMLVVNFTTPWIILGFFGLLLLSYAIWRRNMSATAIIIPAMILLVALCGIFFNNFIARTISVPAPVEVGVSHRTTISMAAEALKENILFGYGPASFGYLWDKFKPLDVNKTPFWSLGFASGSSYLLTVLAEVGLLGWTLLIVFLAFLWYFGVKALTIDTDVNLQAIVFSSFLMFSFTILMLGIYAVGYSLLALGFLGLGALLASLRLSGQIPAYDILLFQEGPRGFISALFAVFLIILSVGGLYMAGARYVGQIAYAAGIRAFSVRNNIDDAENNFLLAIRADGANDAYFRAISQLYLVRAQFLLQDRSAPQDVLGSKFRDALDKSISYAQRAINAEPRDFGNYRNLAKIYELLIQMNVAGSVDAAVAQYDEALKHSPANPLLFRDKATAYLADFSLKRDKNSLSKAKEALLKSVELKPDYAEGHFLLAQIYDAEGNVKDAIARGEAAAFLAPSDIGTLFQLGLLYYRSNRLDDAKIVFERAIEINSNYSNARYFLGLIYDRLNRKADAISEFKKILELNPDNDEVQKIISNLRAGKNALFGITPPPEKRNEPPVKETSAGSSLKAKKGR